MEARLLRQPVTTLEETNSRLTGCKYSLNNRE